jgi:hypothetical protein
MNLPNGVDEATYAKALTNFGYQREKCRVRECHTHGIYGPHDTDLLAPTPELLWEMLVKGVRDVPDFWRRVWNEFAVGGPLAAAVIREMAAMEESSK